MNYSYIYKFVEGFLKNVCFKKVFQKNKKNIQYKCYIKNGLLKWIKKKEKKNKMDKII